MTKSTDDILQSNNRYATTRYLTRQKPVVTNNQHDKIQFKLFSVSTAVGKMDGGLRRQGCFKLAIANQSLITVITIVYNGDKHLEQTIQSVINQSCVNVEYIVIDGGSTDGTLDIIRQYDAWIDYWVSEPDKGIADAMNKGLSLATGEYIVFIHADDYFESSDSIKTTIQQSHRADIIVCDILYGTDLKKLSPRGFNFWINFKTGVYHQAALCRHEVFNSIGGFDTDFKIAMDYDFFLRAYLHGLTIHKVPTVLSVMRDTGISSQTDWQSLERRFNEEKMVHHRNIQSFHIKVFNKLFWYFYLPYRKIKYLFMERFNK